jgi:hypothetical protein
VAPVQEKKKLETKNGKQKNEKRNKKFVKLEESHMSLATKFFPRAAFSSLLKSRVGNIIAKASALRVNLNLDGAPISSSSHTHPSHSQTSRLLTSSLSLGVPVPRPTQCMGVA